MVAGNYVFGVGTIVSRGIVVFVDFIIDGNRACREYFFGEIYPIGGIWLADPRNI